MTGTTSGPHGFFYPDGLPKCGLCNLSPQDPIHVTPAPPARRFMIAAAADTPAAQDVRRSHGYVFRTGLLDNIRCELCGEPLSSPYHPVGMPSGMTASPQIARDFTAQKRKKMASAGSALPDGSFPIANAEDLKNAIHLAGHAKDPAAARAHIKKRASALGLTNMIPDSWNSQKAFVANVGNRYILAAKGTVDTLDHLPERLANVARQAAEAKSANLWIAGRYVEADSPNRNQAFWSADDLQFGQPTVDHGPINWLHEERHIIGALAHSEFVSVEREAAAETGVGSHISALGALWPWVAPEEVRAIRNASEKGQLWFSMECVSREVACLEEGCNHKADYLPYMKTPEVARCTHMRNGGVRRFVDPIFEGAGIIVPPVMPGWANAEARVLVPQAASLIEQQAAAFEGVEEEDALRVVAALLSQ